MGKEASFKVLKRHNKVGDSLGIIYINEVSWFDFKHFSWFRRDYMWEKIALEESNSNMAAVVSAIAAIYLYTTVR